MLKENSPVGEAGEHSVIISRFFGAARLRVFEALLRAHRLARWWSPKGLLPSPCGVDVRRGGAYRFVLRAPDGKQFTLMGVYREVTPPERLEYTERFEGDPRSSREHVVAIALTPRNRGTALTITERFSSVQHRAARMKVGACGANLRSMDWLAELLESNGVAGASCERESAFRPRESNREVQPRDLVDVRGRALARFAELFPTRL